MSCRVQLPSSASGPSRMQVLLPGTAFQITIVASLHLQPSEDIWKRFYSLKFLTLPRTFNIVTSAGHLCKWTQNRRRRWWSWCLFVRPSVTNIVNTTKEWSDFSVNAQVVHGARWNDQLQEVNDQGHTTPKLDLETWRSRHRRPLWSNRFSSFAIIATV